MKYLKRVWLNIAVFVVATLFGAWQLTKEVWNGEWDSEGWLPW